MGFRALSRKALAAVREFQANGYGVDAELVALAAKNGVQIAERPVRIRYRGLKRTSKRTPLSQGGELVKNIVQLMIEDRPLLYLGLPGLLFLLTTYQAVTFNLTQYLSIHVMIVVFGVATVGFTLIVAALILSALKMIKAKIADLKKS